MLAQASAASLDLAALPLLHGAIEQVRAGTVSTMHVSNARAHARFLACTGSVDHARRDMLFDPQTSGGLLIAIPARLAQTLCEALHNSGYKDASIIGEVVALNPDSPARVQAYSSVQ